MAKIGHPPAFLFYPDDFSSDGKVEAMSTEQVGAYILLLCKSWREKPPGSLPSDDSLLAKWARVSSDRWSEIRSGVLAPYTFGTDSRWHQKRQRAEYDKLMSRRRECSKAGKSSANKRFRTTVEQPFNIPIPSPFSSKDLNTNTAHKPRDCDLPGFRLFWHAYPNQVGEPAALRQWLSKVRDDGNWPEVIRGLEKWKSSGNWDNPKYIPNPARFLYEKRWQNDPPADRRENAATPRQQKSKATATALSRVLGGAQIRDGAYLGDDEPRTERIADHGVRGSPIGNVDRKTSGRIQEGEKDVTVLPETS